MALSQPSVFLSNHITDLSHKAALISFTQTCVMKYILLEHQKKTSLETSKPHKGFYYGRDIKVNLLLLYGVHNLIFGYIG